MCQSENIANDLRDKAKTEKVVYWLSDLEDNAARAFSEAVYYYLCLNKKTNYLEFQKAFEFAQEHLKLLNYVLIYPSNHRELEQRIHELGRPDLLAAGVPVFCDYTKREVDQTNAHATEINASSYFDNAQSMDIDTTIGRDLNSPKKRRRNEDVEKPMGDDNMNLALGSSSQITAPSKDILSGSNFIEGKESTCKLKCIYEFACGNRIEANCKFVHYLYIRPLFRYQPSIIK